MKSDLALTDDLYRAIIARVTNGKTSSADLDSHERGQVLDELARLSGRGARPEYVAEDEPQLRLIRLLWHQCAELGALRDCSEQGLRRFVRRVAKVDALAWLSPAGANKVIEGLKIMRARAERAKAGEA